MNARRWRERRNHDVAELNITAFMNLMVILVPFLLITAVFSRLTILELSLPAPTDPTAEVPQQTLQLEVVVRAGHLEVADANTGVLKVVPANADVAQHDLAALNSYLQSVKAQYPEKTEITLLLEPDTDYNTLVQIMDAVRVFSAGNGTGIVAELFPDISIGDAALDTLSGAIVKDQ